VRESGLWDAPPVRPVALLHQEGVVGLLALVGLALRRGGPARWLAAPGSLPGAVALGIAGALGVIAALWLVRWVGPLAALERFQRRLVRQWTAVDALAVALLSGIAEEALLRALLQPLIGLLAAAGLFAVLHLVPDRRLWLWPVLAFVIGLGLGLLYQVGGYPAAAAAHVTINGTALLRLRRSTSEDEA
jgi:membrane protease YdiL (CAAX protease family)